MLGLNSNPKTAMMANRNDEGLHYRIGLERLHKGKMWQFRTDSLTWLNE